MKIVIYDMGLHDFYAWSGAVDTKENIINAGKTTEFEELINDIYPEGLTDTQLNDLLWFDDQWIYETLGID